MIAGWRCQGLVRFLVIGGLIWSCVRQEPVAMQCVWVLYGTQSESFLIDTAKHEVYWVNEDQHLPVTRLDAGVVSFSGRRAQLKLREGEVLTDVPLTFVINRVSGELRVEGVPVPDGYDNRCEVVDRVL